MRTRAYIILIVIGCYLIGGTGFAFARETNTEPDASGKTQSIDEALREMTDIHDIKKPVEPPMDYMLFIYVLIAGLILWVLFFLVRLFRNRIQPKKQTARPLPAHEEALILLGELFEVQNIDGKTFYFRLIEILRMYIQRRYGLNAPEMTTEELLPCVDKMGMHQELQKNFKTLLRYSDPIKFAGQRTSETKMREDLAFAEKFVKETTLSVNGENDNPNAE